MAIRSTHLTFDTLKELYTNIYSAIYKINSDHKVLTQKWEKLPKELIPKNYHKISTIG